MPNTGSRTGKEGAMNTIRLRIPTRRFNLREMCSLRNNHIYGMTHPVAMMFPPAAAAILLPVGVRHATRVAHPIPGVRIDACRPCVVPVILLTRRKMQKARLENRAWMHA